MNKLITHIAPLSKAQRNKIIWLLTLQKHKTWVAVQDKSMLTLFAVFALIALKVGMQ